MIYSEDARKIIKESADILLKSCSEVDNISVAAQMLVSCFKNGNKVVLFGNGGSAADAQHLAAELIGRYRKDRQPLPAIALTTDTSAITAIANDYGYEYVFGRQCRALIRPGDVVIAFSTSGNSKNVINGMKEARENGAKIIAMTGKIGGEMKSFADVTIKVQSDTTSRIQETHQTIIHVLCELVEKGLAY